MKGKLIVIEGPDGSGKSTQAKLLVEKLSLEGWRVKHFHFPIYDSPTGRIISEFLRGDFGKLGDVHPKIVATLFAINRSENKKLIEEALDEGTIVILDRYVSSNIAFQCAKIIERTRRGIIGDGPAADHYSKQQQAIELLKLKDWIIDFEYSVNGMRKPDLELFLEVPNTFVDSNNGNERKGEDRSYLKEGEKDIHEVPELQREVSKMYHWLAVGDSQENHGERVVVDCSDVLGGMRTIESINEGLYGLIVDYIQ